MILVRLRFGRSDGNKGQRDKLNEAAGSYLDALRKNGQIYGDYLFAWSEGALIAYSTVARPDAIAERHHSEWSMCALNSVVELFGKRPELNVIDDDVPKRFASWKRSTYLYLFTHLFDVSSPICCGDTGSPVPLYLLPTTQELREDLYFWARRYADHDSIWLDSRALEIPAYKQLADPKSDLSIEGRELCTEVEQATGKPTFYYLHRYYGRRSGEATRPCPLCGSEWRASDASIKNQPWHRFAFRCEPCRLVSQNAGAHDDERRARIGEFKQER